MKIQKVLLLFVLVHSTVSFRIPTIQEELGSSPTLSIFLRRENVYFDPLNFATSENFAYLREAELKHGRVAMLASLDVIAIPLLKKFSVLGEKCDGSVLGRLSNFDGKKIGLLLLLCGYLETTFLVQREDKDMPGDFGFGYFGVRDKSLNERKLIVELENGRLAMLAMLTIIIEELFLDRASWLEHWSSYFRETPASTGS